MTLIKINFGLTFLNGLINDGSHARLKAAVQTLIENEEKVPNYNFIRLALENKELIIMHHTQF